MLSIESVYNDVYFDTVNSAENGQLSRGMFTRLSKRAELKLLGYISGDIEGIRPPTPYSVQKVRDLLSPFIEKYPLHITNNKITKPEDYYGYENMYLLGDFNKVVECDDEDNEEELKDGTNTPIELLSNSLFYSRCQTFIEGLKPSFLKPIAKEVGNEFEFMPRDLGSITLEYIKYPVWGVLVGKEDPITHDEVEDELLTVNYMWDENARDILIFFITQEYSISTREQALFQVNQVEGASTRI